MRFSREEIEDLKSALSFFIRDYEKVAKISCPETIKAMKKLLAKLWRKDRLSELRKTQAELKAEIKRRARSKKKLTKSGVA